MSDRNKDIFKEWDELNPKGFKYESNVANLNNKYVYLVQEPTFSNKYSGISLSLISIAIYS